MVGWIDRYMEYWFSDHACWMTQNIDWPSHWFSKNIIIDFGVCVRQILRGHMTQGLLIKESTEVNMTRKNGSQATGEFNFYVDGINKWGKQWSKYSMCYAVRGCKRIDSMQFKRSTRRTALPKWNCWRRICLHGQNNLYAVDYSTQHINHIYKDFSRSGWALYAADVNG